MRKGHNHNYQRYAPQDTSGTYDPACGIVEFILGTGGRNTNNLGSVSSRPPISGLIYIAHKERVDEVKAELFRELQAAGYTPQPEGP